MERIFKQRTRNRIGALLLAFVIITVTLLSSVSVSAASDYITLNANGGTVSSSKVTVAVGQTFSLESPHRYGYDFAGWYWDNGFSREFTDTVFAEEHKGITLYAKWSDIIGFESYTPTHQNYGIITQFFGQSSTRSYSGKYSMEYHFVEEVFNQPRTTNEYGQVLERWASRRTYVSGFSVKKISANTSYKLTFKYYVDERTKTDCVFEIMNANDNVWAKAITPPVTEKYVVFATEAGEWKDCTMYFTTDDLAGGVANNLYFICCAGAQEDCLVYIDDMELTKAVAPLPSTYTATFDFNGGTESGGTSVTKTFESGKDVLSGVAVPKRTGYDFTGWYYDKECTSLCNVAAFDKSFDKKTFYAGWSDTDFGFESYYFPTNSAGTFAQSMSIVTDKKHTGKSALKFNYSAANDVQNTYATLRNVATVYSPSNKTDYIISFWYNPTVLNSDAEIVFSTVGSNIATASQVATYGSYTVKADETGWKQGYIRISTDFAITSANKLAISVRLAEKKNATIYFDDFSFRKVDANTGFVVAVNSDNGEYRIYTGADGETADLEPVVPVVGKFAGWCSDEECTDLVSEVKFSKEGTVVYSLSDPGNGYLQDFEDYEFDISGTAERQDLYFGKGLDIKTNSGAHSGMKMLYCKYTAADDTDGRYADMPDWKAPIKKTVNDGTRYAITFSYYLSQAGGNVRINFAVGAVNNIWAGYTPNKNSFTVNKTEAGTGWHTATVIYDVTAVHTPDTVYNTLFVTFNTDTKADYVIYLDDVVVTEITDSMRIVTFDSNDGASGTSVSFGEVGEEIEFPDFSGISSDAFEGWYKDEDCTVPFTDTVFTENMTVYALWKNSMVYKFGFESYGSTLRNGGIYASSSTGAASSGSRSLYLPYPGSGVSAGMVGEGNNPYYLESGYTYFVELKYRADFIALSGKDKLYVAGAYPQYQAATAIRSEVKNITTTYQNFYTEQFTLTVPKNVGTNMALYVVFEGDYYGRLFVDDLTVVKLAPSSGVVCFKNTITDASYMSVGRYGTPLEYPAEPKDSDSKFCGWYTDENYEHELNSSTMPARQVTYAYSKWEVNNLSFECHTYAYKCSAYSFGDDFSITTDYAKDGRASLKYKYSGAPNYTQSTAYYVMLGRVSNERLYKITYDYMYKSGDGDVRTGFLTAHSYGRWTYYREYKKSDTYISENDIGKGWLKAETYVYMNAWDRDSNWLYFTAIPDGSDAEIYFDNMKIEAMPTDVSVVGFVSDKGTAFAYKIAAEDEPITLPDVSPLDEANAVERWYSDEGLTVPFSEKPYPAGLTYAYAKCVSGKEEFENYKYSENLSPEFTVTGESRNKALNFNGSEAVTDLSRNIRLGSAENGATYKVTLKYKASEINTPVTFNFATASADDINVLTVPFTDGNITVSEAEAEYTEKTLYVSVAEAYRVKANESADSENAEYGDYLYCYITKGEGSADITVDSITAEKVNGLTSEGSAVLTDAAAKTVGSQAVRFYFGYSSADGTKVKLGDKEYKLLKRGILYTEKPSGTVKDGYRTVYPADRETGLTVSEKTSDFDTLWKYHEGDGKAIYSAYVKNYYMRDARKLCARGYLELEDESGNLFTVYTPETKASVRTGVDTERLRTDVSVHTVNGKKLSDYKIIIPRDASFIYGEAVEEMIAYFESEGYKISRTNDRASVSANEILVGNTNRSESGALSLFGQNGYAIGVVNGKLVINGASDLATMQGVKAFAEYAKKIDALGCGIDLKEGFKLEGEYTPEDDNYKLTFDDEFHGSTLNFNYWTDYIDRNLKTGKTEPSCLGGTRYFGGITDSSITTASGKTLRPVRIEDDSMAMTFARLQNGIDFYNCEVTTYWSMNMTFGLVEWNLKQPPTPASITLWLNGGSMGYYGETTYLSLFRGNTLKSCFTEIDVMENFGSNLAFNTNVHYWGNGHDALDGKSEHNARSYGYNSSLQGGGDFSSDYHTFSVSWSPERMVFAVDGMSYYTFENEEHYRTNFPLYLLIGGGAGDIGYSGISADTYRNFDSSTAYIDYVRVYQIASRGDKMCFNGR